MTRTVQFSLVVLFSLFTLATPSFAVYNATLGRWLTRDPSDRSGSNLYQYVSSDPLRWRDPSGRVGESINGGTDATQLPLRENAAVIALSWGGGECWMSSRGGISTRGDGFCRPGSLGPF